MVTPFSPASRFVSPPVGARCQAGAAVFLLLLLVLVILITVLVGGVYSRRPQLTRTQQAQQQINIMKSQVLNQLVVRSESGAFPGMAWRPDTNVDGNYDGLPQVRCINEVSGSNPGASAYCLGRWPWKTASLVEVKSDGNAAALARDANGDMPWYAVSMNLIAASTCGLKMNPDILTASYGGYVCNNAGLNGVLPYPWLTVRDARGNVLSNRVAMVIIMPGLTVGSQQRGAATPPASQFLDTLVVKSGCVAPCVAGTYSNADADNDFITGPEDLANPDTSNYVPPFQFNDRVVFITVDELVQAMQQRVLQEVASSLRLYHQQVGAWPWLAPWANPNVADPTAPVVAAPYMPQINTRDGLLPFTGWKRNSLYPPGRCTLVACASFNYAVEASAYGPMTGFPGSFTWRLLSTPSFTFGGSGGTVTAADMINAASTPVTGECMSSNHMQMSMSAPDTPVDPVLQVQCTAVRTTGLPPGVVRRLYWFRLLVPATGASAFHSFAPPDASHAWARRYVRYPDSGTADLTDVVEIWDLDAGGGQIGHGRVTGGVGQIEFELPHVPTIPGLHVQDSPLVSWEAGNWYADQQWYRFIRVVLAPAETPSPSGSSLLTVGLNSQVRVLALAAGPSLTSPTCLQTRPAAAVNQYFESLNSTLPGLVFATEKQTWGDCYKDQALVVWPYP